MTNSKPITTLGDLLDSLQNLSEQRRLALHRMEEAVHPRFCKTDIKVQRLELLARLEEAVADLKRLEATPVDLKAVVAPDDEEL